MKIYLTKQEKEAVSEFAKKQGHNRIEPLYDGFREVMKAFDEKNALGKDEKKALEVFFLHGARTALDIAKDPDTLKKIANG